MALFGNRLNEIEIGHFVIKEAKLNLKAESGNQIKSGKPDRLSRRPDYLTKVESNNFITLLKPPLTSLVLEVLNLNAVFLQINLARAMNGTYEQITSCEESIFRLSQLRQAASSIL